ncbi:hypothetical protein EJB05_23962, partial [Eragrostis curvula]
MVPSRLATSLAAVVIAAATADTTSVHHPPLLDCTPARAPAADDDRAFRVNLASALGALPAAAAAAPNGFALTQSGRAGRHRAFARGLCFGANRSSSAGACRACLSAAAEDVTSGCGGANSRRAAVWRAGCFLAYADTKASSPREDAFRGWIYASPHATTTPDRGCTADRSAADCARCLDDSARVAAALGWLPRIRGDEVVVVGYACYLRVHISSLPWGAGAVGTPGSFAFIFWMSIILPAVVVIIGAIFVERFVYVAFKDNQLIRTSSVPEVIFYLTCKVVGEFLAMLLRHWP